MIDAAERSLLLSAIGGKANTFYLLRILLFQLYDLCPACVCAYVVHKNHLKGSAQFVKYGFCALEQRNQKLVAVKHRHYHAIVKRFHNRHKIVKNEGATGALNPLHTVDNI